ncbi:MAG TPA: hypothetical protein VFO18_12885 [Methylomirabilota bacterium]|nr:hypothetical protein [Methylomirabilota bacterium]
MTTERAPAEAAPARRQRSRRLRWAVMAGLVAALLWSWFDLTGRPQYSLYRLSAAIQSRDLAAAEHYFDVDAIAVAASEMFAAEYSPRGVAVEGMRPVVAVRVRAEIRRMVETAGPQQASIAIPADFLGAFRVFEVSRQGTEAWVSYSDARRGVVRFRMSQQPDRSWKITEFDRDWVRRQLQDRPRR